jgi:hypothetical protein
MDSTMSDIISDSSDSSTDGQKSSSLNMFSHTDTLLEYKNTFRKLPMFTANFRKVSLSIGVLGRFWYDKFYFT